MIMMNKKWCNVMWKCGNDNDIIIIEVMCSEIMILMIMNDVMIMKWIIINGNNESNDN